MDFSVGVQLFRREMAKMARLFRGLFCDWLPAVIVGLPLATILILCQPFKHIRIYSVDCHRIGHLLKHYFYLCEKPLAEDRKNDFHYLIHPASKASNPYWWGKWRSQIQVLPHSVGRWLVMALGWLPGGKSHLEVKYELIGGSAGTLKMLCRQESPVLHFSPKESSEGRDLLDSLGLGRDEYVCMANRDSRYTDEMYPDRDMSYHNFRNGLIGDYGTSARALSDRGLGVVRVGSNMKEQLDTNCPGVVDYAFHPAKSDFGEIYLMAHCRFAIFPESGICVVPELYQRPVVYTNYTSFFFPSWWSLKGLMVFKKFRCLNSGNRLPYQKVMTDYPVMDLLSSGLWERAGLELIDNSPEELRDAALEMDDRLTGCWEECEEDRRLQEKYWKMFDPPRPHTAELQVAATFVRNNPELFD